MLYCTHHLNDLSGSPLILEKRMEGMKSSEGPITLITNQSEGFLSSWTGPTIRFGYKKHDNPALRFFSLSSWYLRTILYLLINLRRGDKLIASTLISSPLLMVLLLRPGVSGELMVNEIFFRVPIWRALGLAMARSQRVTKVYLSKFVHETWAFPGPHRIVYPVLRRDLMQMSDAITEIPKKDPNRLTFFLVGSQIAAKGYRLFIDIARHYQKSGASHRFLLYLSGSEERLAAEYADTGLPENLVVEFNNASPQIFAGKDIFLGLSDPELWVETFGQTFAEAMALGNIVVVPPVGAQLEYVTDGLGGFVFQDYTLDGILTQINRILEHDDLAKLAAQARTEIRDFYDNNQA